MYPASNATNPPKLNFSVRVEIRKEASNVLVRGKCLEGIPNALLYT